MVLNQKYDTKKRILESSYELFSLNGYMDTTTKDIANHAEVNETTLFRNFKDKKNLFKEVVNYYSQVSDKDLNSINKLLTYKDLKMDLTRLQHEYYKITFKYIGIIRIFYINTPYISDLGNSAFYNVPHIEKHLNNYLTKVLESRDVEKGNIHFLTNLIVTDITRNVSDLYGHKFVTKYSKKIDQEITEWVYQNTNILLKIFDKNF